MMEVDRDALCGPKGRHQVERPAWRGGSVDSQVTLGGRQVEVPRLRVRSAAGEVPLASFQWAASTDPLDEHTLAAVAAGVSTRRYASTLDPVPAEETGSLPLAKFNSERDNPTSLGSTCRSATVIMILVSVP